MAVLPLLLGSLDQSASAQLLARSAATGRFPEKNGRSGVRLHRHHPPGKEPQILTLPEATALLT